MLASGAQAWLAHSKSVRPDRRCLKHAIDEVLACQLLSPKERQLARTATAERSASRASGVTDLHPTAPQRSRVSNGKALHREPFTERRLLRSNRQASVVEVQPFPLGDELCALP